MAGPVKTLLRSGQFGYLSEKINEIENRRRIVRNYYERSNRWRISSNTNRNVLVSPNELLTKTESTMIYIGETKSVDINDSNFWINVSTDYTTAANRAGKDFYLFATAGGYKVSDSKTEDSSRKLIGGFHCLCASAGTLYGYVNSVDDIALVDQAYVSHNISGTKHWLDGYLQGDILPFSIWDTIHRPASKPKGMVYDPGSNLWIGIYLASWNGSRLVSEYGGTIADGASTPAFHQYKFQQLFGRQKKKLPRQDEFVSFSLGSPQGVNVVGSADQNTTGGHTATNGQRIVSLIGVEDATGVMWQWGREGGATNDVGAAYADAYDGNDQNVAGLHYEAPNRPLFGGSWDDSAKCGSRSSDWNNPALILLSYIGARGVAEPLK